MMKLVVLMTAYMLLDDTQVTASFMLVGSMKKEKTNLNAIEEKKQVLREHEERELQNIIVSTSYANSTTASPTPTTEPVVVDDHPTQVVFCQAASVQVSATRTEVPLDYYAETKGDSCSEFDVSEIISSTLMNDIANELCAGRGVTIEDITGNSTTDSSGGDDESELPNCVISVTTGPSTIDSGSCTPSLNSSQCCNYYRDSYFVVHTNDCTKDEIVTITNASLTNELLSDSFLTDVNNQSMAAAGVAILKLGIYDAPATSIAGLQTGTAAESSTGLTTVGIAMIAFAALVGVVLGGVALAWRRHNRSRKQNIDEDLKSYHTNISEHSPEQENYLKPDFSDLALRHHKQDVHKCKSALCHVCRPNLGVVRMVPVPQGFGNQLGYSIAAPINKASSNSSTSDSSNSQPNSESSEHRNRSRIFPLSAKNIRSMSPLTEPGIYEDRKEFDESSVPNIDSGASSQYDDEESELSGLKQRGSNDSKNSDNYKFVQVNRPKRVKSGDSVAASVAL